MRLATWNINGVRARLDLLIRWLRARRPDIVGLQELKSTDEQFPQQAFEAEGYRCASHGQKAWNGVAVLSREPIQVLQRGLPGQEPLGARLLTVRIGDLSFTTLYCPNGKHVGHEDFDHKLAWLDGLAHHLERHHSPQAFEVLCGDFNICPTGLDSWNEEGLVGQIFHTHEERMRFRRLVDRGWVDTYRHIHPNTQAFSWWDYRAGAFPRNHGLRIDFLLATAGLAERVHRATIDRDYRKKQHGLTPSDHAPVMIDTD